MLHLGTNYYNSFKSCIDSFHTSVLIGSVLICILIFFVCFLLQLPPLLVVAEVVEDDDVGQSHVKPDVAVVEVGFDEVHHILLPLLILLQPLFCLPLIIHHPVKRDKYYFGFK